jgi:hypothetical protein
MVRARSVLSLIFLSIFICNAFAADVVMTARGKFYHLATCPRVQGKKVAVLDETQAKARGLRPCEHCLKSNEDKNKK